MDLDDAFQIRQVLPVRPAGARIFYWARWAQFFIEKNRYISKYNVFLYIDVFCIDMGQQEWVDGAQ